MSGSAPPRSTYSSQAPSSASDEEHGASHAEQPAPHGVTPSASSTRSRSATTSASVRRRGSRQGHGHLAHHASRTRRHDEHAVAQDHRLLDVVGDEHHGARLGGQDVRQPGLHLGARHGVERGERLVERQHRLAGQQRAQERDALAHPARQLRPGACARSRPGRSARATAPPPPAPRRGRCPARAAPGRRCRPRSATAGAGRAGASSAAGALTTVPSSGRCRPQISSSSVVLPHPLGPTTVTISPGSARSDTPASACTAPFRDANVLLTSSTRTPPVSCRSPASRAGASIILSGLSRTCGRIERYDWWMSGKDAGPARVAALHEGPRTAGTRPRPPGPFRGGRMPSGPQAHAGAARRASNATVCARATTCLPSRALPHRF